MTHPLRFTERDDEPSKKVEDPSGSTTYERDLHGRVTKKTQVVNDNPSSPTTLVYHFQWRDNLLWIINYPSGMYVTYQPYGDGRLYQVQTNRGNITNMPLFTPLGQVKAISLFNGASLIPIGMRRNGRFYSIHADHLGTPRLVKDDTNTPVWQLPYSAFGNNRPVGVLSTTTTTGYAITPGATPLKATTPAERLNLRFPGQYADSETGEFYNYFRNYDPRTGKYTQADPIGLGGGLNRFGYVSNNTLRSSDPLGLVLITGIPGAVGETTIHANPGPNATTFRAEHAPDHVHLGDNAGPRVRTSDFKPLSEKDAARMSRKQSQFCDSLSEESKDLIRTKQRNAFEYGTPEKPDPKPRMPWLPGLGPLLCPLCKAIYPDGPGGGNDL